MSLRLYNLKIESSKSTNVSAKISTNETKLLSKLPPRMTAYKL